MRLTCARIDSPLGPLWLATSGPILCALLFDDDLVAVLRRHHPGAAGVPGRIDPAIVEPLDTYFEGDIAALDRIAVATPGTPFQRQVWAALRAIPAGQTTSYGALAAAIGRPSAVRAVGLANGANPISLVVPCHRVIGADGTMTGYGGGLDRKAWLLRHEGARTVRPPATRGGVQPMLLG